MRHLLATGQPQKPTSTKSSAPSSPTILPPQPKYWCSVRLIYLLLIVSYVGAKRLISIAASTVTSEEAIAIHPITAVSSTAGAATGLNILGTLPWRIEDEWNTAPTYIAWRSSRHRPSIRYDGNTNEHDFYSNLPTLSDVVTYVFVILSVWMMVTSIAHLWFFALSQLQHVAVDCQRLLADRYSKCCCIDISKAFPYHTHQLLQHSHHTKSHPHIVAKGVMAAIATTSTSTTMLFLTPATQLYLAKRNSSVVSLLSHQLFAVYMRSISSKGKENSHQASCTGELLIFMFLLHQLHLQQRQQCISVTHKSPPTQQCVQASNCSKHCGNVYEKPQRLQPKGAPETKSQAQEHELRSRQTLRMFLLYDRCTWISVIVGAYRRVQLSVMTGTYTVHAYYEQDHRHRHRRRRCCTSLPAPGTGVLRMQTTLGQQHPQRRISVSAPAQAQTCYEYSYRRSFNDFVCSWNSICVCCCRGSFCGWDDCCAKNNNYSSTSGKSGCGFKGQGTYKCYQKPNYSYCCCCYCRCDCHFCCFFCCCCCYCFCNCHGSCTSCCCCKYLCCHKKIFSRSAKSDNPNGNKSRTNLYVNDNGKNHHGEYGSSHQQHQHSSQQEYYQQQHKRLQQQHLFYQQNSCFHRRRRRHFCASYTSLHSCCCCFFKWICWRHHNSRWPSENKKAGTVSTLAKAEKTMQAYLLIPIVFHNLLFTSQYIRDHFKPSTPAETQNHLLPQTKFSKWNHKIRNRLSGEPLQKKATRKSNKDSLYKSIGFFNINALRTITGLGTSSSSTSSSISANTSSTEPSELRTPTTRKVTIQCAVGSEVTRTYVRLLRRNLVWLIIGLVWFEGPKFGECSSLEAASADLNPKSAIANYSVEVEHSDRAQISNRNDSPAAPPVPPHIILDMNKLPKPDRGLILQKRLTRRAKLQSVTHWTEATQSREEGNRYQSDSVRLESIKRQILSKLGLKRKPNVTHPLPKQFIWDTIYRADGISSVSDFDFNDNHRAQQLMSGRDALVSKYADYEFRETAPHKSNNRVARSHTKSPTTNMGIGLNTITNSPNNVAFDIQEDIRMSQQYQLLLLQQYQKKQQKYIYSKTQSKPSDRQGVDDAGTHQHRVDHDKEDADEFYGRTQEIITFADRGETYKKHQLIEFSRPVHEIPNQKLHIRHAEIHIRIDKLSHGSTASMRKGRTAKLKLWIFQLPSGDFTKRGFDQMARFCTSLSIDSRSLGWQKINLTDTVQKWYELSSGEKLRLLIDCSGCGKDFVLHLFEFPHHTFVKTSQKPTPDYWKNFSLQKMLLDKAPLKNKTFFAAVIKPTTTTLANLDIPNLPQTQPSNGASHSFRKHQQKLEYWRSSNVNRNLTMLRKPQQTLNNYKYFAVNSKDQVPNPNTDEPDHGARSVNAHIASIAISESVGSRKPIRDFHSSDVINPNRPFLVLHTEPKRSRRVRRRVIDCDGALHGQCCKESFYVSFKALGWDDWIIAPRGYFANYCRGDCSGPYRTPDTFQTFHTHFIEEYRKMGLLNGMQPCCAPVKFSSMSLIYYGDDGIIKRDLPKMVIDECGCP